MFQVFNHSGNTAFFLQYNGNILDTAQGLDSWIRNPNAHARDYPFYCYYNQGQNAGLVDGVQLTGQTSGTVIKVGRVVLTGGALGSSTGLGVLFFNYVGAHTVLTSGENLRVSTTTYCVAASSTLHTPAQRAKSAVVMVEDYDIRYTIGGVTPTVTSGTPDGLGILVAPDSGFTLNGPADVDSFMMIHALAANNATVHVAVAC
jgi:hypothetical protein